MYKVRLRLAAVCLAAAVLAGCQSAGLPQDGPTPGVLAPPEPGTTGSMPTGQQVIPPYGYIGFCLRDESSCQGGTDYPAPVVLTSQKRNELDEVNTFVNRNIPQIEDQDNYGRSEFWAYPNQNGGDCEDLALLKQKMLKEKGWPLSALLLAKVKEWNGIGHVVLLALTDRGEYVLDNKNWQVIPWKQAPYAWVSRQSTVRPYVWVSLEQKTFKVPPVALVVPALGTPILFVEAARKFQAAQEWRERQARLSSLEPGR